MSLFFLALGIWVNDDYELIFSSMWCPVMVKIIKSLDLMQHHVAIEGYVKFVAYLLYIKSGGRYATVFGVRIYSRFGQQQHVQGASTKEFGKKIFCDAFPEHKSRLLINLKGPDVPSNRSSRRKRK